MPDTFKAGDVVELKSGSPPMTVAAGDPNIRGWLVVVWFSEKENTIKQGSVPAEALTQGVGKWPP